MTPGRALMALDRLDEAEVELDRVLRNIPDHPAALRARADICVRRGHHLKALTYRAALSLAPRDPELQQIVRGLRPSRPLGQLFWRWILAPAQRSLLVTPLAAGGPQPLLLSLASNRTGRTVDALEQFLEAVRSSSRR